MGRRPTVNRDELLATARRIFGQKGFERATLADIAGELGVTPAALLRHVESKQALFAEAMRGGRIELPEALLALATVDASLDPRVVLRRFALEFIPFVQQMISVQMAVHMHRSASTSLVVPFDTTEEDTPPRRGIRVVEDYFRRAHAAGVVRIDDPPVAARLFLGPLHAYVLFHHVLRIPSYPLGAYVDAHIELWTRGAFIAPAVGGKRARKEGQTGQAGDRPRRPARRSSGGDRVLAAEPEAAAVGPERDAGGADGKRRVARRRTRHPGPRR